MENMKAQNKVSFLPCLSLCSGHPSKKRGKKCIKVWLLQDLCNFIKILYFLLYCIILFHLLEKPVLTYLFTYSVVNFAPLLSNQQGGGDVFAWHTLPHANKSVEEEEEQQGRTVVASWMNKLWFWTIALGIGVHQGEEVLRISTDGPERYSRTLLKHQWSEKHRPNWVQTSSH